MKFLFNHINDIMDKLFANINHKTPIGANCKFRFTEKICYFKLNIPISAAAYNGKIIFFIKMKI